jgi:hypothetical protein
MRNLITLALGLLLWMASAEAQILRIGERVPTIDVDSSAGSELKLVEAKYTCLIFMHSESEPSIEAIRHFSSNIYNEEMDLDVVLLTPEQDGFEEDMLRSITTNKTIVAFDNEGRTFANFNIEHIPFAVVYNTASRRALWFGPLARLTAERLASTLK